MNTSATPNPVGIRGITTNRSRHKISVRLRKVPFDKALTIYDSCWDNPEDHKKVQQLIHEGIIKTGWLPNCVKSQEKLYAYIKEKGGAFKNVYKLYPHIKSHEPTEDPVLSELRSIKNYLQQLTVLLGEQS